MPKKKKGKDLLEDEKTVPAFSPLMAKEVNPKDKRVCPECGSTRTISKLLFPGKGLYRLCNNCFKIFDPDGFLLIPVDEAGQRVS